MKYLLLLISLFILKNCQAQEFEKIINYYKKEKKFNGAVLVATNGKVDFLSAVGLANRQTPANITSKSIFKIASITKTFTAVLILKLKEEGRLDLNTPISKYLKDYNGLGKDSVTIHHLLTYSSGIPNCEGNTGIQVYQTASTLTDFIAKYCSGKPEFKPGTGFNYNNSDYILLGRIIEEITGKPFAQNVTEYILKPLNMANTGMLFTKTIVPGLADTYNIDDSTGVFFNDDPMYIENYYSAGAMYSTVEDLLKFDQGIFTYKVLNKSMVDLMLTPNTALNQVAYGFWVYEQTVGNKNIKLANRQGSIWGANANWIHLIDSNKTIIVLSNTNATNLNELSEELVLVATGQKPTIQY